MKGYLTIELGRRVLEDGDLVILAPATFHEQRPLDPRGNVLVIECDVVLDDGQLTSPST